MTAVRRLLIAAFVLLPGQAQAVVDPKIKSECMKAQDFVGCVKALSGTVESKTVDEVENLRVAMKQVADRLAFGTSLLESTETFRPVVDALALAKEKDPTSLAVKVAKKATDIYSLIRSGWQGRINGLTKNIIGEPAYSCIPTQRAIDQVNQEVGSKAIIPYSASKNREVDSLPTGFMAVCAEETVKANELKMIQFVAEILREGAASQSLINKHENERKKSYMEAEYSLWQQHLRENKELERWVKANPKLADQKRKEFNAANPPTNQAMPSYSETQPYLSKFKPPLD